ncbi:hypothetical protein [Curtobacterium sp. MCSS17_016]|uniref:hypothetical protein n=1 Tax=Curtobacterium sp. MCSS17_016 TaxID=2175644 RepID=UPI0015E8E8EB|nr:hypothetical protein [Curtobacterium sp. MCSS17_016]WIE81430.1 hypothetical protein DEJ19_019535 [Curtobacterium sp. MCSS17_016]
MALAQARTAETVVHWVRGHSQVHGATRLHRQVDRAARRAASSGPTNPSLFSSTDHHLQLTVTDLINTNYPDVACTCGWVPPVTGTGDPYPSAPAAWTLRLLPESAW